MSCEPGPSNVKERDKPFLCGVVEGFYGRPWTTDQRKDLFTKMRKWGMDSYLYAPKDDYKHRAFWREQYTVEEADHLSGLVAAAKDKNIRFIYAISPGLDIVYSSSKDISALKRKLEQVTQLGCEAFAILFDDIDPEMTKADKEMFKSFAHAQYCATRAVPDVPSSEYLLTIGAKLVPQIDIMWTGPKVISKDITIESIQEITDVIRRPPVIWDNIHANDYDQNRIFLGPYAGRSPHIIPHLRGVLTNPNCEYGANFVAIHTLAQWSKCSEDTGKKLEAMNPDAKLETENNEENIIPEKLEPHIYHPIVALRIAIEEWIHEFNKGRAVWGPIIKPQIVSVPVPLIPSVNTCISVTATTGSAPTSSQSALTSLLPSVVPSVPTVNCSARDLTAMLENGTDQLFPSPTTTMMNSLVADNKILRAESGEAVTPVIIDTEIHSSETANSSESDITEIPLQKETGLTGATGGLGLEPMDTATPPIPSPQDPATSERDDVPMVEGSDRTSSMSSPDGVESGNTSVSVMHLDSELELTSHNGVATNLCTTPTLSSTNMQVETTSEETKQEASSSSQDLKPEDLHLLCDLFYLPYEHGAQGLHILQEFQWLKTNSNAVAGGNPKDKLNPEAVEWFSRATKFDDMTKKVNSLANKLNDITNRELLYEIYPYLWDIRGVVSLLNSYVKWLAVGQFPASVSSYTLGTYTWFSKGWRETFMSGDQEPWVIRGGLTSELQRLLPVDRGTDLFMYKAPVVPSCQVYTIRPYRSSDETAVYKVCLMTFKDGLSAVEEFSDFPKLAGDINIGGYLTLQPDISFVVEDENETVVGAAVGILDAKEFRRRLNVSWLDVVRKMYPQQSLSDETSSLVKEAISSIQSDLKEIPEDIRCSYPAELRFFIVAPLADPSVPKRLMTCVLAAFRANGIFGCFVEASSENAYFREFFKKLGFVDLNENFLGRSF